MLCFSYRIYCSALFFLLPSIRSYMHAYICIVIRMKSMWNNNNRKMSLLFHLLYNYLLIIIIIIALSAFTNTLTIYFALCPGNKPYMLHIHEPYHMKNSINKANRGTSFHSFGLDLVDFSASNYKQLMKNKSSFSKGNQSSKDDRPAVRTRERFIR